MEFHKYPRIDNFEESALDAYYHYNPERFIVQEKIDGCNIGLYISKDEFRIASRNQFIDGNFYNIKEYMYLLEDFIQDVQNSKLVKADYLIFYGEFYGPRIQKRINYGQYGFAFFDVCVINSNEIEWLSYKEIYNFFDSIQATHLLCPVLGEFENIYDAAKFCQENLEILKSVISCENDVPNTEYTQIEGFVISSEDKFFKLKHKSPDFIEKTKSPIKKIFDNELMDLRNQFLTYINENRFHSVMSKIGAPTGISQSTEYIYHLINDAKEEFEKDFQQELAKFSPKEKRFIYNAGGLPFEIFKKFI